jgi:hypothetical protein
MSVWSNLRRLWRRRDQTLAERAYEADSAVGPLGAGVDETLASARAFDPIAEHTVRAEDALEHEEPE